ncbi:hypothetical protein DB346_11025 [Verrucomicrobia bacterium LW23]|nr:hypothetical protein DB346_11025 [Verrucomicrobia bacterium LW23]
MGGLALRRILAGDVDAEHRANLPELVAGALDVADVAPVEVVGVVSGVVVQRWSASARARVWQGVSSAMNASVAAVRGARLAGGIRFS